MTGGPLRLYELPLSGNCWKIRLCLAERGLPYERVTIRDPERTFADAAFRRLSPLGRVPVLVCPDGTALWESGAILTWLAENTPLLPRDATRRAQVMAWLFWEQADLSPALALPRFFRRNGTEKANAERMRALQEKGRACLEFLDTYLSRQDYLCGAAYTLADLACHVYVMLSPEGGQDLAPFPAVRAWLERIAARRAWEPLLPAG